MTTHDLPSGNPETNISQEKGETPVRWCTFLFLIGGFLVCALQLFNGWSGSILDLHGWRQCYTALPAYYFLKEGFVLDYQTPLLGRPWSIPFEFPLYQYAVATVAKTGILPLDQCGRLVSILFWIGCLAPLHLLLRECGIDFRSRWEVILVVWSSPAYLFWSRCFLIESCVLFFSLFYLYFFVRAARSASPMVVPLAILFGIVAALTKATTFLVADVPALLFFAMILWPLRTDRREFRKRLFSGIVILLLPILCLSQWTMYADFVKSLNPAGNRLASQAISAWNYGTFSQKTSLVCWYQIYRLESLYAIGRSSAPILAAVFILFALLVKNRYRNIVWVLVLAFMSGPLLFTNLFLHHEYYYYEIDIYLEVALGLAVLAAAEKLGGFRGLFFKYAMLGLILATGIIGYDKTYLYCIRTAPPPAEIERQVKPLAGAVGANGVLLVYGLDWDPSFAYYSHCKCIMEASWGSKELTERMISNLSPDERLAGVVMGGVRAQDPVAIQAEIERFELNPVPIETLWGKCFIKTLSTHP